MSAKWNEIYSSDDYVYGTSPNVFFKEQLDRIKPGMILLPCEGEGRNAVYAAKKGWAVAAFDSSEKAREKAVALASKMGISINYAVLSANNFGCGFPGFDAVALIFAHFPSSYRANFHNKIHNCLLPGGVVLLEAYSKKQLKYNTGGPKDEDFLYSLEEIEDDFSNLNILYVEELVVELFEGNMHNGKSSVIRMIAQKSVF